jgi:hypothetical protein
MKWGRMRCRRCSLPDQARDGRVCLSTQRSEELVVGAWLVPPQHLVVRGAACAATAPASQPWLARKRLGAGAFA